MENFKIDVDSAGLALITFDCPGRSMNTITAQVIGEIAAIAERLKTDDTIKGAVLASGKESGFCAGADLGDLGGSMFSESSVTFEQVFALNKALRALETCGKPVACALEGLALGGGLEIALACHYRVASDNPKIQFGLPEAKVGLIPGGGGTQRLPRLIGVQSAAMMILQGETKKPQEAKSLGFINELVAPGGTIAAAKAWLATNPRPVAPWDEKGFRVKDGPYSPSGSMTFIGGNGMVMKQTLGNYPAQKHILSALYEGIQVPIDAALRIESRYFAKTLRTPEARAMVRTLFGSMQELGKGANRPVGPAATSPMKVGVLGAGFMGAGVAYVQAAAGIETVLIDRTQEDADRGKEKVRQIVDKRVSRGAMSKEKAEELMARITPTTDYGALAGADLVIEAVFENREIKAEVTKRAEAVLGPDAVFGSNTSTLPITGLAEASARPENFIGVHFFSPVEKMMLVEIIMGAKTSQETLAKAIDYTLKIKKTPIVVNDSRGFYTSRVVGVYIAEGWAMLDEGYVPAIIENIGRQAGMPVGPLSLNDEVAIDLSWKIAEAARKDLGDAYAVQPGEHVIRKMVTELERYGRKNGKGFYEYAADGSKRLWPGLADLAPQTIHECPPALAAKLKKRILYRQSLETARCFEEGILTSAREADVGSILGWGFAPFTGGTVSLIDTIGVKRFIEECEAFAAEYGARFAPNTLLRDMAAKGETFYSRFGVDAARAAA